MKRKHPPVNKLSGARGRARAPSFYLELARHYLCIAILVMVGGCSTYSSQLSADGAQNNVSRIYFRATEHAIYSFIRWPSERHYVSVIFGAAPVEECAAVRSYASEINQDRSESHDGMMGELCHNLYVFSGRPGLRSGHRIQSFYAEHESFHLAVQSYGFEVPLQYVRSVSDASLPVVLPIFRKIASSHRDAGCESLVSSLLALTPSQLHYLAFRAWWEWPAEYHAFKAMYSRNEFESYRELRRTAVLDPTISDHFVYIAGVAAGMYLDKFARNREWRSELRRGENMLNVYLEVRGCNFEVPVGPTVALTAEIKR